MQGREQIIKSTPVLFCFSPWSGATPITKQKYVITLTQTKPQAHTHRHKHTHTHHHAHTGTHTRSHTLPHMHTHRQTYASGQDSKTQHMEQQSPKCLQSRQSIPRISACLVCSPGPPSRSQISWAQAEGLTASCSVWLGFLGPRFPEL